VYESRCAVLRHCPELRKCLPHDAQNNPGSPGGGGGIEIGECGEFQWRRGGVGSKRYIRRMGQSRRGEKGRLGLLKGRGPVEERLCETRLQMASLSLVDRGGLSTNITQGQIYKQSSR